MKTNLITEIQLLRNVTPVREIIRARLSAPVSQGNGNRAARRCNELLHKLGPSHPQFMRIAAEVK